MEEDEDEGNPYFADMLTLFCKGPVTHLRVLRSTSRAGAPIFSRMRSSILRFQHVTHLCWDIPIMKHRDVMAFIEAFPSAAYVCFDEPLDEILDVLLHEVAPGGGILWPHLHTFYWALANVPKAREFVQSRIDQEKPLRELWMRRLSIQPTEEDVEWLEKNVESKRVLHWDGECAQSVAKSMLIACAIAYSVFRLDRAAAAKFVV